MTSDTLSAACPYCGSAYGELAAELDATVKRVSGWLADYDDNAAQLYEEGNASDDNLAEFDRDDIRTILRALYATPPKVGSGELDAAAWLAEGKGWKTRRPQ
jgi:hypothetical protein